MTHEDIELTCIALGALALLMQTAVLVALYFGVNKAAESIKAKVEELHAATMPILETARGLLTRIGPQVEKSVADVGAITGSLRVQAAEVEVSLEQILQRVNKQSSRIDTMFSGTLDAVDKASTYVVDTVSKPVRQLSGLLASVKAIVESLRASDPSFHEPHVHDDKDMFV